MSDSKLPPQSIEAEMSLLGSLMLDKDAIVKVVDFLEPRDFYKPSHQMIYGAMEELFEKGEPIDVLSAAGRLKEKDQLEEIGGNTYLTQLINTVPTASHVLAYAKIVQKKRILRDLISVSYEIGSMGYNETEDPDVLLDKAESSIFSIAQRSMSRNFVEVKDTLEEAFERIDKLSKHETATRGVPTGFGDLDNILSGFQKSDLIILAARPSLGKCVTGDTEIVNPTTGEVATIQALVEGKKHASIFSLSSEHKICENQISAFLDNGIQDTYLLRTALGKEIKATGNHPLLTISGWRPLNTLQTGERIAVPRNIPVFGKNALPEYKVKALAYFVTEGGLTNSCPRFTTANKKIEHDFLEAISYFRAVKIRKGFKRGTSAIDFQVSEKKSPRERTQLLHEWGIKLKKLVRVSGYTQKQLAAAASCVYQTVSYTLNGHSLPIPEVWERISDALKQKTKSPEQVEKLNMVYEELRPKNSVTEFLKETGMMGKLAIEKCLPQTIFTLPQKETSLFLNRIFACDGSFWRGANGDYHLSYASSSRKLAQQVQHLLLRFGVVARLRSKQVKYGEKYYPSYELEAHSAENLISFIDHIGVYGKEDQLVHVRAELVQKQKGWTNDTVPMGIWGEIIAAKGEESWRSVYQRIGKSAESNMHAFRREPRRETVALLADAFHSENLSIVSKSDVYWDRIISIEPAGKTQVYDLTIPSTHNFIANDIVIHNSALAMDIARRVAVNHKIPVGVFSLEMSKDQVIDRLIASQGGVDLWRLRTGKLSSDGDDNDFSHIQQAMGALSEAPIFIEDSSMQNVLQMRAQARRLQANHGLGLLIVDYLQLIEPRNSQVPMVQQVTEISRSLKGLARELNVPVLALSQLSRAVEQRTPQRPRLSDLRETGALEQDSDVVLFIYREDKYKPDPTNQGIAEIIIAKHRNGPVGSVKLYFNERTVSFTDLAKGMEYQETAEEGFSL